MRNNLYRSVILDAMPVSHNNDLHRWPNVSQIENGFGDIHSHSRGHKDRHIKDRMLRLRYCGLTVIRPGNLIARSQ
jgi:hypothetical protein